MRSGNVDVCSLVLSVLAAVPFCFEHLDHASDMAAMAMIRVIKRLCTNPSATSRFLQSSSKSVPFLSVAGVAAVHIGLGSSIEWSPILKFICSRAVVIVLFTFGIVLEAPVAAVFPNADIFGP